MTHLPLISANHIYHQFDGKPVLQSVSLQLHANQITTLIGPNGAGKSTLVKILLKLIKPTQGQVIHHQTLVIGFMPQKIHIDPTLPLTVQRFLQLGQKRGEHHTTSLERIADELGVRPLLSQAVQSLSGGEMQRVLLARALIRAPNLLVLDEPVQGIDLKSQAEIYQLIHQQQLKRQCAVLMISHDLHLVMKHTDEVLCLNQHICCSGDLQSLRNNPIFIDQFAGGLSEHALYQHHHTHCNHG
ncbi:MAG: metal ABC transporter ATP-binding protein [Thiomicrospira sp.]|jgi:zinc transport system ATP-binding protein|nr:metal ABC transporter ATP-binding protein [Thiomicrospira sp.]